ncbi:hypothetical protein [Nitrosomonas sp.]|uniref:hypothetical protein n=1 Tax=Nitrosomonas sp. TaxID=42353 RepID=UPI0025FC3F7A|nr:hypothetical protein [Nitrosomonas sp.]MBY0485087.1 hypothetical protein [Nitrosomonas sp.]
MTPLSLESSQFRTTINPDDLGFSDTSGLLQRPLFWIGHKRVEVVVRFGLGMMQPSYLLLF